MSTYNGKIKIIKARSRNKRLREIGGTASTVASSREVVAAPSVDLSRYVLKSTFDDLFEKVNLGTDAAPKWAIKAKYNFYTVGWLSFRGANDGSGGSAVAGAANLSDLKDVSLGSLAAGQALVWNGAKWVNSTIATSGLDESSLSNYLSSHGYATQSWVNSQNYVTQQWVAAQDYLTKAKSDALYVTAIGTSGNNLTYIKGGITNNITVPYAAKTRLLEEAYGLARGSYDALQERPDELPAGLRVKFKGYPGAGVGPESYWNTVLDITAVSGGSVTGAGYRTQFLFSNSLNESDGTFWVRNGIDATWNSWQQVFTTGNYQGLLANTFYNKTEVNAKLDKKLDKATFDDLFEKVNLGTDAAPKWAIKAKYNFYTVGWLSFRGANDGSGGSAVAGAANLSDLKDVSLGSLAAGQALVWNGAKWVNSTIATSGLDEASLSNYLSSHGYATQAWANGAFVNKAGDTMTGPLAVREIDAPDGNGLLAYAGSWSGVDFSSQYGVGTINRQGVIRSGNASLVHYRHGAGNATIWDSLNDGSGSGLDADLLDGVHNGEVTARLVNYNNGGNVSSAVQFMQKKGDWNAWDAPTQNWYSVIKLNHGNGDTYYSRVLAFDFHSDNIYTHRKHNGTDYGWRTLAFTDSTVANANLLDGLHLDSVRGYRVEHPAINSSLAVGNVPFNAFGMQHGTPLFIDPEFASGTNNVSVYNNLRNGNVTVTRIADNQASANSSGYILQIKVTGAAEPWTGGFVQLIQSRANAVFMQMFRAKIPVGYNVNANSNPMGDNYSDVWITSTAGTDKWEWYARVVYCGASGSFSHGGYVSLKGANATAANPLYWYLSHCQTWDLSKNNYGSLRAKFADALSASRTLWGQSFNGSNNVSGDMAGVGTITSTYYSLHNISNNPYLKFNVGGNITYVQALSTGIGVGPTHTGLFVSNDSKVGIGTASPSEKLSIAGWVGTIGATGWYNITYQGGWHMADSTWIRTYNNKNVYAGSAIIRTDGAIQVGNGGSKFYANSSGVVFAATGIWTAGYMSFRGQNTSSDARQKRILRDIHVPLTTIAKAPNVVFSWLDNGKLDMGSIAQYWHKHLPLSVYVRDNGYLGMDYSKVALACVISMASELLGVKDDVSTLKQEVRQLRHENRELKQQIDKMERRIA